MWTKEEANYRGDFYRLNDAPLKPKPINSPKIFQGGNCSAAKEMAGRVSDVYFMNGGSLEKIKEQIDEVRTLRKANGKGDIQFAVNGFVIVRDTEEEGGKQVLRDIVENANREAVEGFEKVMPNRWSGLS